MNLALGKSQVCKYGSMNRQVAPSDKRPIWGLNADWPRNPRYTRQREGRICKKEKSDNLVSQKIPLQTDVSVMQRVNCFPQVSTYGKIKMPPEKDKKGLTFLFVDWQQEKPENKKRFEGVPRTKERRKEELTVGEFRHPKKGGERERHICIRKYFF